MHNWVCKDELHVSIILILNAQQLNEYVFVYELACWQLKTDATYM